MMEYHFHPTRAARDLYGIDRQLFTLRGTVFFGSMRDAQLLAARMNERRKPTPGAANVQPAELYAAGILHEVYHFIFQHYRKTVNASVLAHCDGDLGTKLTHRKADAFIESFVDLFPPVPVYEGKIAAADYLRSRTDDTPHRHVALEELILVWIENRNPALAPMRELVDDSKLEAGGDYTKAMHHVDAFFETQPPLKTGTKSLIKLLMEPMTQSPQSLMGQLEYVVNHWEEYLGDLPIFRQLLTAQDYIREEGKYFAMLAGAAADKAKMPEVRHAEFHGWGEKESAQVQWFRGTGIEVEPERFTADLSWMPRCVIIAKTTYVWLDQLSKKYHRAINRLDEIPEEELDILARRGFTGLWLIGIWQRSHASQRIKHIHGNIDAVASAYSLNDYIVAPELGGDEGYRILREKAAARGLRLASDMVPNHMGMDSSWVVNHPDWFVQADYPPFPNYTFDGPDLSSDPRVGIFLEDGYWRKTDAAVVFKRLDRWTGTVKYIYHGNDGTNMAWNDTAQLNFMKREVREAVIQTILHVARMFPIIRFDAAMILAKRHYQRLWFPQPGTGGAIPSRAGFAMTKEQFDAELPEEFWREVVDRVQHEVPDTLLLAEAFWMMEGYFVRSLGMHRVYNSAFMNMLKKEENANYRQTIKNVLEFNPQILKRYVNFMNNPDEETAVAQFGKDDRYFGVAVLMCTMPGLPMWGHGQTEGFTEKYGMEYRRAYYNETPDEYLVHRHEREIFPLLKRRYLFSEVENFHLFDCVTNEGTVNEDVYAYTNRAGNERGLVLYNNRFSHAQGRIRFSAPAIENGGMVRRTLADALGLSREPGVYLIFRDQISGLEYIHRNGAIIDGGLWVDLQAFKYRVYLDFREVRPTAEKPYDRLESMLNGRGVQSIEEELLDLRLQPVHNAVREAISIERLNSLMRVAGPAGATRDTLNILGNSVNALFNAVAEVEGELIGRESALERIEAEFKTLAGIAVASNAGQVPFEDWQAAIHRYLPLPADAHTLPGWRVLLAWLMTHRLGSLVSRQPKQKRNLFADWRLEKIIAHSLQHSGVDEWEAWQEAALLTVLTDPAIDSGIDASPDLSAGATPAISAGKPARKVASKSGTKTTAKAGLKTAPKRSAASASGKGPSSQQAIGADIERWMELERVRWYLGVNRHNGIDYFNKEKFERLIGWSFVARVVRLLSSSGATITPSESGGTESPASPAIAKLWNESSALMARADQSGYDLKKFLSLVSEPIVVLPPPRAKRKPAARKPPLRKAKSR